MANNDIKNYAKEKNVSLWRIADELKMTDSTFSKKLRKEFSEDERSNVMKIINKLSKSKA